MLKKRLLQTLFCSVLLASTVFTSVSFAGWIQDGEDGGWHFQQDDGTYAASQWIHWNGETYYIDKDGLMAANQTLMIDGTCYGFYSDGRVMHGYDITDVQIGWLNLYSSEETIRTVSSRWAYYSMELPGNTSFIDYIGLAGKKPVYEFLATVPSSGNHPLTVSSSYFQMEETLDGYAALVSEAEAEEKFQFITSLPVTLGNERTYQKLSFVYDPDGVYGRPVYRDCYLRKIGDFCHILTIEYESEGADMAKTIEASISYPKA